ncbi:MAG: hypothetical protein ACKOEM_10795 [Planctomycetia bacterium]
MNNGAKCLAITVAALGVCGGFTGDANAQGNGRLPFSNMYSRPAVSPYTMLGNPQSPMTVDNQTGAVANNSLVYQQIIQPQLQQQQQVIEQNSQSRQLGRLQNQVQQIQRDTRGRQIDETIRPTGHASTYQNLSHFYPRR